MDPPGFEPGASGLQSRRSPSLSYGPKDDKQSNVNTKCLYNCILGGDPAAGSPTATLLRLHPPQKT